jgi:hypothetical protein
MVQPGIHRKKTASGWIFRLCFCSVLEYLVLDAVFFLFLLLDGVVVHYLYFKRPCSGHFTNMCGDNPNNPVIGATIQSVSILYWNCKILPCSMRYIRCP